MAAERRPLRRGAVRCNLVVMAVDSPRRQRKRFAIAACVTLLPVAGAACAPIDTPGPEHLDAVATLFDGQSIPPEAGNEAGADAGAPPIDGGLGCDDGGPCAGP